MRGNDCFGSRCRRLDGEAMMPFPDILADVCWIAATVGSFLICRMIYQRLGQPLLHPVLWSTIVVVVLIGITHHPLSAYRQETAPLVWLLGPAVVAMAVPIWERRTLILANWFVLAAVIVMSLVFAVGNLYLLRGLLGDDLARALTLKSVTAPVAISIARGAGLQEHLALVGVMMSGMFGMVAGPLLLSWFGSRGDRPDLGIALGCAAHGLGTARAFEIGPTAGAFASVSMGLSALSYGVLLPPILSLV
jgi:putative effector of murein hydrolase